MVFVQEEENFWDEKDWREVLEKYYNPLIEMDAIGNFKWEVIPYDNFYRVRRSFFDVRARTLDADQCGDSGLRPKQLLPHIQIDVEVTTNGGSAEEVMEFIQNYRDYWPEGMEMTSYVLGQAKDEDPYSILTFANYTPAEDEEDEDEDDEEYGDVMYEE